MGSCCIFLVRNHNTPWLSRKTVIVRGQEVSFFLPSRPRSISSIFHEFRGTRTLVSSTVTTSWEIIEIDKKEIFSYTVMRLHEGMS